MPLILIAGLPSSGKSSSAKQIKGLLSELTDSAIHLVSDNEVIMTKGLDKNSIVMESHKEKELRGILKSEALRLLTPQSIVILDSGNYIKGYRYELYCAAKNTGSTQVTVETICPNNLAWEWNSTRPEEEKYTKECFDALHLRYEAPDSRNRWDSPLFYLQVDDEVPVKAIYEALFLRKPPPPNQSTQTTPLSKADFLYELDKITQSVVADILSARRCGAEGSIKLSSHGGLVIENIPPSLTPAQLARYRRQFLNYTKLHPPCQNETPDGLAQLFTRFLNSTLEVKLLKKSKWRF